MKKLTNFFNVLTVIALTFLSSCNKDVLTDRYADTADLEARITSVFSIDTIIQPDSTKFPKRSVTKQTVQPNKITADLPFSSYNVDELTTLYQLDGIPFYIRTLNTSLGNTHFTTNGQGQEITIQPFNESTNQQFYFQFLPASTGIPLLIRSMSEGTPIGAGSYPNSPDNYVLFTHGSNNSLFGASWDLKFNADSSAYYIENQDLFAQGPGGIWDIYNYVLQSSGGSIQFSRLNSSLSQQFTIVPIGRYIIGGVDFDYDNGIVESVNDLYLRAGTIPNYSYDNPDNATLSLQETTTSSSSFKETSGITRTSSGGANVSFSLPGFFSIGGSVTLGESSTTSNEYSSSSTYSITFTETYNFPIPPRTTLSYNWIAKRYKMYVPYRARCVSEDGTIFFYVSGMYEATSTLETVLERQFISIDDPTNIVDAPTLKNIHN